MSEDTGIKNFLARFYFLIKLPYLMLNLSTS